MNRSALILFAHGARDPRWAEPFLLLRQLVQTMRPELRVELAFLELMTPSLPTLTAELVAADFDALTVVPIFLGQGGHLRRDLPLIVEQLREAHPGVNITVAGAAGENSDVLKAIAQYCVGSVPRF